MTDTYNPMAVKMSLVIYGCFLSDSLLSERGSVQETEDEILCTRFLRISYESSSVCWFVFFFLVLREMM